jgi:hypothetical protein
LVAVARYGADRLREIAAVAEESGVRLRWTLRNRTAHDVPGPSASRGARQLAAWGVEVIATETHRGAFGGPVWWRVAVPALPRGV